MTDMGEGQGPHNPRYGEYNNDGGDKAEIAVRITSADFNGKSFDGSPFSVKPEWLLKALQDRAVDISPRHGDRDYAVWSVVTTKGIVDAFPGDYIIRREHGDLSVVPAEDAFILINLRAPHLLPNETEREIDKPINWMFSSRDR
jgi:hypothetical protein